MDKCPLSGHSATLVTMQNMDGTWFTCEVCGEYGLTREALFSAYAKGREYILSGITRRESDEGRRITISTDNIEPLLDSVVPPRDPQEVLDRLILYAGHRATTFSDVVNVGIGNDYPIAFARNGEELSYSIKYGTDSGLLDTNPFGVQLTAQGWHRFNDLRDVVVDSSQAFVAMWFDSALDSIWTDGLKPALAAAGYRALRIDEKRFNDKIDDQIIAEIRRSGLLVADVTGHRGGVYFEAGFALGLGIPVIWTCRKDDLDKAHFDTRQYNHIDWEDASDLRRRLIDRVRATGLAKVSSAAGPEDLVGV